MTHARSSIARAVNQVTRRRFLGGLGGAAVAAAFLAACGGEDEELLPKSTASGTATTDAASTATGTATAATASTASDTVNPRQTTSFPAVIEHKYGTTTIEAVPRRVVTIGYTDHDVVLALGVTPIAMRDWYGNYPSAVWHGPRTRWGTPSLRSYAASSTSRQSPR